MRFGIALRKVPFGRILLDAFFWFFAVFGAGILRFEFDVSALNLEASAFVGLVLVGWGIAVGSVIGLYSSRFTPSTFDEFAALSLSAILTSAPVAFATAVLYPLPEFPRSTVAISFLIFLFASGGSRVASRLTRRIRRAPNNATKAIIYGAGQMSEVLIPQLLGDKNARFLPVALIDDDPAKSNRWIAGVRMKGSSTDLRSVVADTGAEALIVSIPTATSETLRKITALATPLGISIHLLPTLSEVLTRSNSSVSLRTLSIEDLIGRRAVKMDTNRVGSLLAGKTVLITGAGGSIGVELCRQVASFEPKRLIMLDRDETGLQHAQLLTYGSGLLESADLVLADIREADSLDALFATHRPDVVFHAAALKHLPMLEKFPDEAWKTNVEGTLNVLNAALKVQVKTFVNISTDKAADPTSVLGHSKKLGEQLTAWASSQGSGNFLSVRFGNVLGSRGSLVPTLTHMIESGGPVLITDPRATRYFMTISEACQLVLQAGTAVAKASVFVLDMGLPVRILDVAERMIDMASRDIDIVFTGLRPGEKLHETLSSDEETLAPSDHALINFLPATPLNPRSLKAARATFRDA